MGVFDVEQLEEPDRARAEERGIYDSLGNNERASEVANGWNLEDNVAPSVFNLSIVRSKSMVRAVYSINNVKYKYNDYRLRVIGLTPAGLWNYKKPKAIESEINAISYLTTQAQPISFVSFQLCDLNCIQQKIFDYNAQVSRNSFHQEMCKSPHSISKYRYTRKYTYYDILLNFNTSCLHKSLHKSELENNIIIMKQLEEKLSRSFETVLKIWPSLQIHILIEVCIIRCLFFMILSHKYI